MCHKRLGMLLNLSAEAALRALSAICSFLPASLGGGIATGKLQRPDGSYFEDRGSIQYLGALICGDGRADSEISRKIGTAKGDFNGLQQLWGYANVSKAQKVQFFEALICQNCVMD